MGINVRRGCISNMADASVWQPLLVNTSAITLATETVQMLLENKASLREMKAKQRALGNTVGGSYASPAHALSY